MKIRIVSLFMIVLTVSMVFFGCTDNTEEIERTVISDGVFKIGCLLPENNENSQHIKDGFVFASTLADTVNLTGGSVSVEYVISDYSDADDISAKTQSFADSGVAAVVFDADSLDEYESFSLAIAESGIPAISLNSFTSENDNIFNLTLSQSYMSSATATYAMEKGYTKCAVLCETGDKYNTQFAETFTATYKGYAGTEPTVYYKSGDNANYTPAALVSESYDSVLMLCADNSREQLSTELRDNGFLGEIMFTEVLNKNVMESGPFENCSYLSKLNEDISNNISTVFYSMYSEYAGVKAGDVTAATAYGYDAYMLIFEALKSFSSDTDNAVFSNTETKASDSATGDNDIKLSDLKDAVKNVVYYGVTDIVRFKNNQNTTTYIYVDYVSGGKAQLAGKYTFAPENNNN